MAPQMQNQVEFEKFTYLSVILQPLGSNGGNSIVDLRLSSGNTRKGSGQATSHRLQKFWVDVLLEIGGFLCMMLEMLEALTRHGTIFNAQKLSLVVSGDRGISVGVPWEERKLLWQVGRIHIERLYSNVI